MIVSPVAHHTRSKMAMATPTATPTTTPAPTIATATVSQPILTQPNIPILRPRMATPSTPLSGLPPPREVPLVEFQKLQRAFRDLQTQLMPSNVTPASTAATAPPPTHSSSLSASFLQKITAIPNDFHLCTGKPQFNLQ